jgi:general secretion pathway protein J
MTARAPLEAGFSLVELLVAIAILGMLSAMLLSGLVTGRKSWQRVEQRTQAGEDVMASQQMLRDLVRRLYPQGSLRGSAPFTQFTGDEKQMLFDAAVPDAKAPAPPQTYHLSLSAAGALVLDSRPALSLTPDRMAERTVISTGLAGLEIAYFGPDAPGLPPIWQHRWERRQRPPQAIRIRARFPRGDRRVWPDLLVQPAATIDNLCVFVPTTGRCRGRT